MEWNTLFCAVFCGMSLVYRARKICVSRSVNSQGYEGRLMYDHRKVFVSMYTESEKGVSQVNWEEGPRSRARVGKIQAWNAGDDGQNESVYRTLAPGLCPLVPWATSARSLYAIKVDASGM